MPAEQPKRFESPFCRFNEAGAGCPGMPSIWRFGGLKTGRASMRPGQAAPECVRTMRTHRLKWLCFNEAGAGCPGMLNHLFLPTYKS